MGAARELQPKKKGAARDFDKHGGLSEAREFHKGKEQA